MQTVAKNYWPDSQCAKAFWGQHDLPPYRQLLSDTLDLADPQVGQRWLDLGCGGGAISRGLWERSGGSIAEVVGMDCAAANATAYRRLRESLTPPPGDRVRFLCHNFSEGLGLLETGEFDSVVSGLSITYAESFDPISGRWTTEAYDRLLEEVCRVLRPGCAFVFSVNVPEPSWGRVARHSLSAAIGSADRMRFV
jgi:SAM-dependent methyltransferase